MTDSKIYLFAGGVLLVGAGAGIIYYMSQRKPKSMIQNATATRNADGTVTVRAAISNTGGTKGYFKLQALVVALDCPQGKTGYTKTGDRYWGDVLNCVNQGRGVGCYAPAWQVIEPGQIATLQAGSPQTLPVGNYGLFVNAAVSTEGSTQTRLYTREYYYWSTIALN